MDSEHHVRAANRGCRRLRRLVSRVRKENAGLHKWHETLDLEHAIILVARQSPATLGVFVSRILRQSKQRECELLRACDYRDAQITKLTNNQGAPNDTRD